MTLTEVELASFRCFLARFNDAGAFKRLGLRDELIAEDVFAVGDRAYTAHSNPMVYTVSLAAHLEA